MSMPMPEQPPSALDMIESAEAHAITSARLAAEALDEMRSRPGGTASAFRSMALLENRNAVVGFQFDLTSAKAMLEIGREIGRAEERAAVNAERERAKSRFRIVGRPSPDGKESATAG